MSKQQCTAGAAVRLMLKYPFWSELYYSMKVIEEENAGKVSTLATNGQCLWVHPPFYNKLALEHKISALAHEVGHKMYLHMLRCGDRDPFLWNVAGDYRINFDLQANKFQPIPGYWLYDPKYDFRWSTEMIYNDLLKKVKPRSGSRTVVIAGHMGDPNVPQEWKNAWQDVTQIEGTPAEIERASTEIAQLVERAIASAQAMGHAPVGIAQELPRVFAPAEEPWYNHLRRYMQSLMQAEFNWRTMNRRAATLYGMCAPDNWSPALGDVLIYIDCTGSCFDRATQLGFASHVSSILCEAKPKRVIVAYFEMRVLDHEEIEPHELDVKLHPKGGGGTSFSKLFTWAEDMGYKPEVAIVLTDMYGDFPAEAPEFPVVWASITNEQGPFGETVFVK